MFDILGMRDLYYSNIISFKEFKKYIKDINKENGIKMYKMYHPNSREPFTNITWDGYFGKDVIYSFYITDEDTN